MNPLAHLVVPQPIDDIKDWLAALIHPSVLTELALLAGCVLLAWVCVSGLRRAWGCQHKTTLMFGAKNMDGVLFPPVLLLLAYVAWQLLANYVPGVVLRVAIPVFWSLLVIRLGVKVLQAAFPTLQWVRVVERTISWAVWLVMVLWVSGLLPVVLHEMESITWRIGGFVLSVRSLVEGLFSVAVVLVVSLWISAAIETRLLRSVTGDQLSLRKAISNAVRALLMLAGLVVALSTAGIDLTALSVLGGALGVGIGFGLQKLAANYVSGFVILAERSLRIGDNVRIDNFEGTITQINVRYTVVRSLTGRESIVPNELLITNRVENLSLMDRNVYQSTVVSVPYDADVELVSSLLVDAARSQPRVLHDPAPAAHLSAFGPDGLEFTVSYWLNDLENGQLNLRSLINKGILSALHKNGIHIPYPQRVIHTK